MGRPLRTGARAGLIVLLLMATGATTAVAADPPVKIVSVTPDPDTQDMTVNWIAYNPVTRVAQVSVTPDCYLVTVYPGNPVDPPYTFLTGVGGADVFAEQRGDSRYAFVVGGTCGEPITLTFEGLKPGPATLSIGVLLYAEHADFNQLTYEVILR